MNVKDDRRGHKRWPAEGLVSVTWKDEHNVSRSVRGRSLDISQGGLRLESPEPVPPGALVFLEADKPNLSGSARVCHSTRRGAVFMIGLEFSAETSASLRLPMDGFIDYYEVLQISPNAEPDTIHRVYRIMAARFHPDNPETGDANRFLLLAQAYQTLSDPRQRSEYDAVHRSREHKPLPVFELRDFVDDVVGEANRRLGVLCLLYNQRRICPEQPGLSLLQLEQLMSFPREYLTFSVWYLKEKQYLAMGEDSDYVITAPGADYVEAGSPSNKIVHRLLQSAAQASEHEGVNGSPRPPVDSLSNLTGRQYAYA